MFEITCYILFEICMPVNNFNICIVHLSMPVIYCFLRWCWLAAKRIWTLTEINNINKYIMSGTGHLTSGVNFTWSGARWSMSVHPLRLTVSHASLVFIGACWFVDHQMICTCIYIKYIKTSNFIYCFYSYLVSALIGTCWFVDHEMICTYIYKIYQNLKYY